MLIDLIDCMVFCFFSVWLGCHAICFVCFVLLVFLYAFENSFNFLLIQNVMYDNLVAVSDASRRSWYTSWGVFSCNGTLDLSVCRTWYLADSSTSCVLVVIRSPCNSW